MQAIVTTYHGPSAMRGARISAKCDARRIIVPYEHGEGHEDNHRSVALRLADELHWLDNGEVMHGGALPQKMKNGDYAWVLIRQTAS